ncbi:hypothetical protein KCP78_11555 [Salmonella enterica subsp. enterica]|nr:hypothetical protein KCP78_11555 [Salmonella enterica subsp. enterica]
MSPCAGCNKAPAPDEIYACRMRQRNGLVYSDPHSDMTEIRMANTNMYSPKRAGLYPQWLPKTFADVMASTIEEPETAR